MYCSNDSSAQLETFLILNLGTKVPPEPLGEPVRLNETRHHDEAEQMFTTRRSSHPSVLAENLQGQMPEQQIKRGTERKNIRELQAKEQRIRSDGRGRPLLCTINEFKKPA